MTGLYVALLVTGVILFIGSFLFVQHLSGSDIEEIKKLSEKEIGILIDSEFTKKEKELSEKLTETTEKLYNEFDTKTDRETADKILEIGKFADEVKEQADTVLSSIGKSHDEIVFMHDRLNDKQEKLSEMTAEVQRMEAELRYLKEGVTELLSEMEEKNVPIEEQPPEPLPAVPNEVLLSMREELLQHVDGAASVQPPETKNAKNERILRMYREGASEVEIATETGIGLGEVKLILGLFR